MNIRWIRTVGLVISLVAAAAWALLALAATQHDIIGPSGSGLFGRQVVALANGNIVITDPGYDAPGPITNTGAVYLYNGASGALISQLTGSQANDQVGSGGVVTLTNGNYVVLSPSWDNGAVTDAGAATWGSSATGIVGFVSASNSLVGSTASDGVGYAVAALSNGNYVVRSPDWDNGAATDAGAATWGNGTTGITGIVSIANSLVGSTAGDRIGDYYGGVTVLSNGNYVVSSPWWDNGTATDAGVATWGNGATGITGPVSIANSLVGSTAGDWVGGTIIGGQYRGVTALTNGNYVVLSTGWHDGTGVGVGAATWGNGTTGITGAVSVTNSLVGNTAGDFSGNFVDVTVLGNSNYVVSTPLWDNGTAADAGAVTWGNGTTGTTGSISIANSLIGSTTNDQIGNYRGVTALSNDNYVVSSPLWNNGPATDVGAITWGSGTVGVAGAVSVTNSLVGNTTGDMLSYGVFDDYGGVTALSNGNYVVSSPGWDNGLATNAGAVTWGDGTLGTTGIVSTTNSLVGNLASDRVGFGGVAALSNGNYVVSSPRWANGAKVNAGAVTWGNGTTGITGVVSVTNSLAGGAAGAAVGDGNAGDEGVTALSNGNYVVRSPRWANGAVTNAGAVTWGNGTTGITGVVSIANSLVGSAADDYLGYNVYGGRGVTALRNGNYVVRSPGWNNGAIADAGAVTWGNGTTGITGVVSIANSLVGSRANDRVGHSVSGRGGVTALGNDSYVVYSPIWNNGAVIGAGAVTLGDGRVGTVGPITVTNSVRGTAPGGGWNLTFDYDYTRDQLVVGRPADNIVTLLRAFLNLELSKSVTPDTDVPYHGVVTYTVVLKNTDPLSDTTVLITDTLPPGVAFGQWVTAPGGVIRNGNAITWTGILTHNTAIMFSFTALHTGNYDDVITNTAYFDGAAQAGSAAAEFSVTSPRYIVAVNATGTGSGVVSSTPAGINCGVACSAIYAANTIVTLTATSLISSTFTNWIGDVVTTTNPIVFALDADKAMTATFVLKTFVITPTAGANGSIMPNLPQTVNYDASRTFTITPDAGYRIADVGVDGVSIGAVSVYTFTNVTANHIITAAFTAYRVYLPVVLK